MAQALRAGDRAKRVKFSKAISRDTEDDNFLPRLIFVIEQHFISAAKLIVKSMDVGTRKSTRNFRRHHDSLTVNMFCGVFFRKVYGPFIFEQNTTSGQTYLEMLQQWLFPKSVETLKISSFYKIVHHRIGIAMFEVF